MSGDTVYIVDDDLSVCESLDALLSAHGFETAAFSGASAFLAAFEPDRARCVVLDVRMPGMDGLSLLEALARLRPEVPVIMMTAHGDVPMAVRAMRAGAVDFVEKPFDQARLIQSIAQIGAARPAQATPAVDPELKARFAELTPRETEVMREMVSGHPNKIIAHRLGMSPRTVEIHRGRVMQKTGAASLSHLVRMAIRAGHDPDV